MKGLFVKLFGRPRLLLDGREVALTPLQLALLGLLYGHTREGLGRGEIAHLLWDFGRDGTLRRRLSQLLYALRQEGGEGALLRAGDILGRAPNCRSELDQLEDCLEGGRFRAAASLVVRGFLDVLPIVPTKEYQSWLDGRRAGLRRLIRARASTQWALAEGQGQWSPRALSAAHALYLLEPESEAAMRNVMWAQALCSSPIEALGTYDAFFDIGVDQQRSPPAEETRILLQRVRSLARQKSGTAHPARTGPPEPRMYGREATVAAFRPLLFEPEDDCLTTVAISGEAGLGKTRVLQESLNAATLQGRLVLQARLAELEKDVALNALTEALSTREVAEVLGRVEEPWRSVVLQFLPEFAQVTGDPIEVPEIQRDSVHRRLLESLRQIFIAIAKRHSFVLVLDDFHWIDDSSLAALEYVRRRWQKGAGTIVVTYRPEYVTPGSKLEVFLGASGVKHLALAPLDQPSQRQLIGELSEEVVAPRTADRIVGLARGNPLFLIELTRQWMENGADPLSEVSGELSVPNSIRKLFDRRLSGLPPESIRVLEALSVWGRVASLHDLERLTESTADRLTIALEHLDRAGLVRWTDQGTELWHELLRQSVLGRISGARRQLLHRRSFQQLLNEDDPVAPEEMALHCHLARDSRNAFRYSCLAAERAESRGAIAEAIRFLRIRLDHAPSAQERVEASLHLAILMMSHWRFSEALAVLEAAKREARKGEFLELLQVVELRRLETVSRLGLETSLTGDRLETLADEAEVAGDQVILTHAVELSLRHAERSGDLLRRAERGFARLDRMPARSHPAASCRALRLGFLRIYLDEFERADRDTLRALEMSRSRALRGERLASLHARIAVLAIRAQLDTPEGKRASEEARSLARKIGDLPLQFGISNNLAMHAVEVGELERARVLFDECTEAVGERAITPEAPRLWVNLGEYLLETGRATDAESYFTRAAQLSNPALQLTGKMGIGLCAIEAGELRRACKLHEDLSRDLNGEVTPLLDSGLWPRLDSAVRYRMHGPHAAIDSLVKASELEAARRPGRWLRLQIEIMKLRTRNGIPLGSAPSKALRLARELCLVRREAQVRQLVAATDSRQP